MPTTLYTPDDVQRIITPEMRDDLFALAEQLTESGCRAVEQFSGEAMHLLAIPLGAVMLSTAEQFVEYDILPAFDTSGSGRAMSFMYGGMGLAASVKDNNEALFVATNDNFRQRLKRATKRKYADPSLGSMRGYQQALSLVTTSNETMDMLLIDATVEAIGEGLSLEPGPTQYLRVGMGWLAHNMVKGEIKRERAQARRQAIGQTVFAEAL